jgi:SAM-dependent methyltransferase
MHWLFRTPPKKIYLALKNRVLPNLKYLKNTKIRQCRCCGKPSIFLQFSEGEEFRFCMSCRANLRYEMLAEYLRSKYTHIESLNVLEFDPDSPLQPILRKAKTYVRTYFDPGVAINTSRADGALMADVTRLQFPNKFFDLIVSSEVLEHVPDLHAAFSEIHRVLRPGGVHIFTVPPAKVTKKLALVENGKIKHLVHPPEYHGDPLGKGGILAFWHLGPEFPQWFSECGLEFEVVMGPEGKDERIIWRARRLEDARRTMPLKAG